MTDNFEGYAREKFVKLVSASTDEGYASRVLGSSRAENGHFYYRISGRIPNTLQLFDFRVYDSDDARSILRFSIDSAELIKRKGDDAKSKLYINQDEQDMFMFFVY